MSQLKINQNKSLYLTGSLLFALSGFFILSFLQPFTIENSYADSGSTPVDTSVTLEPTLSISTDVDAVNLTVNPSDYESLVTGDVNVNVSTNNATGYTLSVASSSSTTALVNKDNNNITIPTLDNETTATAWEADSNLNNKWGFTHDNAALLATGTYLPIVATNENNETTIKTTDDASNSSNTKLTFATKIDSSQAGGEYDNTIVISAVANNVSKTLKQLASSAKITTMQAMTSTICSQADPYELGEEDLILTDTRDQNEYTIRKFADGHCWMVDNLKLEDYTLTSADSNVEADLYIPAAAVAGSTTSINPVVTDGAERFYDYSTASGVTGDFSAMIENRTSICPKNWRLPTGGASGDWGTLLVNDLYGLTYEGDSQNDTFSASLSDVSVSTKISPLNISTPKGYIMRTTKYDNGYTRFWNGGGLLPPSESYSYYRLYYTLIHHTDAGLTIATNKQLNPSMYTYTDTETITTDQNYLVRCILASS